MAISLQQADKKTSARIYVKNSGLILRLSYMFACEYCGSKDVVGRLDMAMS
jgi:hypothetical protein